MKIFSIKNLIIFALTCTNLWAGEKTLLRVCKGDKDFTPYTNLVGTGKWQELLKKASQNLPIEIKFHEVPRNRCIKEVKINNDSDALFIESNDKVENQIYFPTDSFNKIDKKARIATIKYVMIVRKGSRLTWDGKKILNLEDRAIGLRRGRILIPGILSEMKIPYEETETSIQSLKKLELKRVAAVIIEKDQIKELKKKMSFSNFMELPIPFTTYDMYLGVSGQYYLKNKKLVENLWEEIRRLKN